MTKLRTMMITLVAFSTGACLYDGEGTAGLPCNVDADCSAQFCVDGFCGGPAAAGLGESGSGSGSESGDDDDGDDNPDEEEPTEQVFEDACEPGTQTCVGSNALAVCTDQGQLTTYGCEARCGMDNPAQGGCSSYQGQDYCWCASSNGPPSGSCGEACSSDFDCAGHEACILWGDGTRTCGPATCEDCFASGYTYCSWDFGHNCTGASCS